MDKTGKNQTLAGLADKKGTLIRTSDGKVYESNGKAFVIVGGTEELNISNGNIKFQVVKK